MRALLFALIATTVLACGCVHFTGFTAAKDPPVINSFSASPGNVGSGAALPPAQPDITYGAYALWTGKWETVFFKYGGNQHSSTFELKQVQSKITGTSTWDNGIIDGWQSKTAGVVIGTWSEAPTYQPPADAGDLELRQSPDGNSFTGKWRYGSTGPWAGEWNGRRIR